MNFIYSLLAKYLGPKFVGRAATTLVAWVSAIIGKYLPMLDPELLARWSGDTIEIVSGGFGLIVALVIDAKLSKPEAPKVVKE